MQEKSLNSDKSGKYPQNLSYIFEIVY